MKICTGVFKLTPAKIIEVPAHPGVPEQAGRHAALVVVADLHEVLLSAMRLKFAEA